ncbi:YhbY family RNA-binding protein [Ruminococcus sp.]|uniref:YhbY family RNA-binding protein n=1 Tax=Ruminococcus sp. TaxID=41978 RepID=UPI003AF1C313
MLNSKQRAKLRSIASHEDTIFQIGKSGVTDEAAVQIENALRARELVKIKVLENAPVFAKEAAAEIAEKTGSQVVTVIGTKVVLYKKNDKDPKIEL